MLAEDDQYFALHHSHKKRKDSLKRRFEPVFFSL